MNQKELKAIIVSGSRNWTNRKALYRAIVAENPDQLIHGHNPSGADKMADEYKAWLSSHGWIEGPGGILVATDKLKKPEILRMPAPFVRLGKPAGMGRNAKMLNVLLDLQWCGYDIAVVAAPLEEGSGTQGMIKLARKAIVRVEEVKDA